MLWDAAPTCSACHGERNTAQVHSPAPTGNQQAHCQVDRAVRDLLRAVDHGAWVQMRLRGVLSCPGGRAACTRRAGGPRSAAEGRRPKVAAAAARRASAALVNRAGAYGGSLIVTQIKPERRGRPGGGARVRTCGKRASGGPGVLPDGTGRLYASRDRGRTANRDGRHECPCPRPKCTLGVLDRRRRASHRAAHVLNYFLQPRARQGVLSSLLPSC